MFFRVNFMQFQDAKECLSPLCLLLLKFTTNHIYIQVYIYIYVYEILYIYIYIYIYIYEIMLFRALYHLYFQNKFYIPRYTIYQLKTCSLLI